MKASLSALFSITFLLFSPVAQAGHDVRRTVEFLGFSADGNSYLLLIRDEQMGDFFSLRSFDTGKQVKGYPIENPKDEFDLKKEVMSKHKITEPGLESLNSPDGRFTIVGVPKGQRFEINVLRGNKTARFQTLQVESGASGPAKVTIKSVFWYKDGRRLVVIIHKVLRDENGIDADEALPYKFFPSALSFE